MNIVLTRKGRHLPTHSVVFRLLKIMLFLPGRTSVFTLLANLHAAVYSVYHGYFPRLWKFTRGQGLSQVLHTSSWLSRPLVAPHTQAGGHNGYLAERGTCHSAVELRTGSAPWPRCLFSLEDPLFLVSGEQLVCLCDSPVPWALVSPHHHHLLPCVTPASSSLLNLSLGGIDMVFPHSTTVSPAIWRLCQGC